MHPHLASALTVSTLALSILLSAGGCEHNAATGRSQLVGYSREQEIQLGTSAMPSMIA